ncbi:hypothetical protein EI546_04690 [Aequorivita sp. H23M31]|uniref:Carboxypeptidase-like regulatory domain-containing protein n=1 Tax=Aequorivita ciconiae TaxID=2494375 RepID=A0A410G1B7_9FLAO|nr:carboxypeptidase-like regulatory domain-containing protein [Aequorivita sp. H23M31]QAA81066.1 hypothetical protein EI546_04690 [Aequorivita sp. H23M31]
MVKKLLFLLFFIISPILIAQDIERVKVEGKIIVPQGEDAEGISVYNISSQKGTVTDEDGSFEIAVAENDRLQIFALQYKTFTVVMDKGVVEKRKLKIFLNPGITQLDEVVIRPYDLSGNIRADIEKIPTYSIGKDWDLSYKSLEFGYDFRPDEQSSIKGNVAEEALGTSHLEYGLNFVSILGGVGNLLFPKGEKSHSREKMQENEVLSNNMQKRFSREFIYDNFDIPRDKAFDFLYFAQAEGLNKEMLKPENELELMSFLQQKSREYKKRSE